MTIFPGPDSTPSAEGTMPENPLSMMLSALAGAGFEKFTNGINKLAQSGQDINQIFSMPGLPMMLAGAGLKDAANSMEIAGPLLESLQPPPEPEQPDPQHLSAAIQMLSARMGPGMSGVQVPQGFGGQRF